MALKILFRVHALITLLAAIVLVVKPAAIPATVNASITERGYLLCYLLAAAELAIAFLSYFAAGLWDREAVRLITKTLILFHLVTAVLELYALKQGVSAGVLLNVVVRVVISGLFYWFGLRR